MLDVARNVVFRLRYQFPKTRKITERPITWLSKAIVSQDGQYLALTARHNRRMTKYPTRKRAIYYFWCYSFEEYCLPRILNEAGFYSKRQKTSHSLQVSEKPT
ncbi:hypothetical protein TNCV_3960711 [Trichonephila clavipes]|nr:hypothetical protein TNCV_3960711 [Trichonephila clavipes]